MRDTMIFSENLTIGDRCVRHIELRRAQRANALSIDMMNRLTEAVRGAGDRCILLTAKGSSFCAGLDLHELAAVIEQDRSPRRVLEPLQALYTALFEHAAPTACLVAGAAVAGGLGLAIATDCIVAAVDAPFAIPARIPLLARIPAAMAHARVPTRSIDDWIGWRAGAEQAKQAGLVDQVVSATNARSYATSLAEQPDTNPELSIGFEFDAPRRRLALTSLTATIDQVTESVDHQIEALKQSVYKAMKR